MGDERSLSRPIAGRDGPFSALTRRVLTAAVLLPAFLAALFLLPNLYWSLLMAAAIAVAAAEWGRLAGHGPAGVGLFTLLVGGSCLALLAGQWQGGAFDGGGGWARAVYLAAVLFWIVPIPLALARGWCWQGLAAVPAGWLVTVPTWLAMVYLQQSPGLLLALLGVVWIADSVAYFAGSRFGRRRLAPAISPGKTWEGAFAAYLGVAAYALAGWPVWFPQHDFLHGGRGLLLAWSITTLSIIGDLFESWMKRQAGVKDSGKLLPGHGGILDRIDGLTAGMPAAALAMALWLPRGGS